MQRSILSFAALAMLLNVAAAANYTVGAPSGGWDQSTDLRAWASSITFFVGDTLIFSYTLNHDVVEVSEANYPTCQVSTPIQTYTGGNTVIPLTAPGKRFFVCGTVGHCAAGMKVEIDVLAATSPTPSSPPPTTPAPSSPPPISPSTSPVSSPSPTTSSPAPANSPVNSPPSPLSPASNSPASSPTSSPPPTNSTVPPAPPSSANKESVKTNLAMGFGLVIIMILTL